MHHESVGHQNEAAVEVDEEIPPLIVPELDFESSEKNSGSPVKDSSAILMLNRSQKASSEGRSQSGVSKPSKAIRATTPASLKEVEWNQVRMKQDPNSFFDHVRSLVSKKKRRYHEDGVDLDLTYITKNIIAMGFPSQGVEGLYRNRMKDMQKFFNEKHPNKYVIYNLCSERQYDVGKFQGRVFPFPFDDHNCPPFDDLEPLCESLDTWLSYDKDNVAAIHCKAGKGRTGLVICVYLLHTGTWKDANSALNFYAVSRTTNMKGVTIPSQKRWVRYYEKMLKRRASGQFRASRRYRMKSVFVSKSAPKFTEMIVFNERTKTYNPTEDFGMVTSLNTQEYEHPQFKKGILLKCRPDLILHKDVKIQWNEKLSQKREDESILSVVQHGFYR
jgi:protein-tyrosine phosphatase